MRGPQVRELIQQMPCGPTLSPDTFPFVSIDKKRSATSSVSVRPLCGTGSSNNSKRKVVFSISQEYLRICSHSLESAFEVFGSERTGFSDQFPRCLHLPPHVPEQHAADACTKQVVDDAFFVGVLPIGKNFQARIQFAHRFVAQLEHVGVKKGQVM